MEQFFTQNSDIIIRLFLAITLGGIIGLERLFVQKEAGMKTHALVSLGSALFIIISQALLEKYGNFASFDPTRMASQIIVGIGFLGAGLIVLEGSHLRGLTTASGLWVTAGIGMAVGFSLYNIAIITTIFVLVIFVLFSLLERPIKKIADKNNFFKE